MSCQKSIFARDFCQKTDWQTAQQYYNSNTTPISIVEIYKALYDFDESLYYEYLNKFKIQVNKKMNNFSKGMKRQVFISKSQNKFCQKSFKTEYFNTLISYLNHFGRHNEIENELKVHRNTIRNRLNFIENLCEISLDDAYTFACLYMSYVIYNNCA